MLSFGKISPLRQAVSSASKGSQVLMLLMLHLHDSSHSTPWTVPGLGCPSVHIGSYLSLAIPPSLLGSHGVLP